MTWPSGLAMSDIIGLAVEGPIFTGLDEPNESAHQGNS
jgi:hypothetical protein